MGAAIDRAQLAPLLEGDQPVELSVVVPALDEAGSLPELLQRIDASCAGIGLRHEVLVVDDGSTDGTPQLLRELAPRHPALRPVVLVRNYGKSAALSAGFARVRGALVVTMDADLQDDPAEIGPLLAKLAEGYDLVSGWKQDRKDPFIKTSTSKLFNAVTGHFSGLHLHDFNCGLKAYRRPVVESLQVYGELHRYLPVLAHVMGFRVAELPVRHHARQHGVTKFGRERFLNGMLDLMTVLFLSRRRSSPLHFFGRVGLGFGLVGGAISLWFLGQWMVGMGMRLRPLMLLGIAFLLVAIQFVSLGLLAELLVASRDPQDHVRVREEA